ncbi:MAG: right-handed parallel beta-helix repeat-containing protein [Thermoguttaceae bacterium]|nr:right-handed parallel beta-helix repeat-containing protein [Thermoguttaceae bacterium]
MKELLFFLLFFLSQYFLTLNPLRAEKNVPEADILEIRVIPDDSLSHSAEYRQSLNQSDKSEKNISVSTLAEAQRIWRQALGGARKPKRIHVLLGDGTYFMEKELVLTDEDRAVPLIIEAEVETEPTFCGSMKIDRFKPWKNGILVRELSESEIQACRLAGAVEDGNILDFTNPGQVFENGHRMRRARFPDFDPNDPYRGGFLYVFRSQLSDKAEDSFDSTVGCIHNQGDSIFYEVRIPEDGTYCLWMFYGTMGGVGEHPPMDGRISISFDSENPIPLSGMRHTGGWTPVQWDAVASVDLKKGMRIMRWKNEKGGGINLGGFILSKDPNWTPQKSLEEWNPKNQVLVSADAFFKSIGKQLSVSHGTKPKEGFRDGFRFEKGDLKAEWAKPGVELRIFQSGSCRAFQENTQVETIDEEKQSVILSGPECVANLNKGDRYFMENHLDFLNAPGEWFFDSETGKLYVFPENPEADIRIGCRATLISVKGELSSENVARLPDWSERKKEKTLPAPLIFRGIRFTQTAFTRADGCVGYGMGNRGTIELLNTANVFIEDCAFTQIGRYAVMANGGGKHKIKNSLVKHAAQGGFLMINSRENIISGNRILHVGEEAKHIGGVVLTGAEASENTVSKNHIQFSSRYGITMKNAGKKNFISENLVFDTSLETYDTGAIEVTQGSKTDQSGTSIVGNVVIDTHGFSSMGPEERFMSWGIYLDSFAGGYFVAKNYVANTSHGGFMLQGGKGNTVVENTFVNGREFQGFFANYIQNSENLIFDSNTVVITDPEAAFFAMGKDLSKALTADKNSYLVTYPVHEPEKFYFFEAWKKKGFDLNASFKFVPYPLKTKEDFLKDFKFTGKYLND